MHILRCLLCLVLAACMVAAAAETDATAAAPKPVPALRTAAAAKAPLLGAAWAGPRAVAVGEYGTILLSDNGKAFRQARSVPVSSVLTAVAFVDATHGWAVGHWGAILATTDGGETWHVQRLDTQEDRPLFAVHFFDAQRGVAVGLWSLVLTTDDGGKTWTRRELPAPPGGRKADLNLLGLFADVEGAVYATAERGNILHSADHGKTWQYFATGAPASLWTGAALPGGGFLVAGQGGTLLHAPAISGPWEPVPLRTRKSVTALTVAPSGIWLAGLDGLQAHSTDGGKTFTPVKALETGVSATAVLARAGGSPILLSRQGVAATASQ